MPVSEKPRDNLEVHVSQASAQVSLGIVISGKVKALLIGAWPDHDPGLNASAGRGTAYLKLQQAYGRLIGKPGENGSLFKHDLNQLILPRTGSLVWLLIEGKARKRHVIPQPVGMTWCGLLLKVSAKIWKGNCKATVANNQ